VGLAVAADAQAAVNAACAEGTYETTITEVVAVDRMAVRRWLAK